MQIKNITELFALNDQEFIQTAYENLLGRNPDEPGMRYYLGRLALGYTRQSIILQLASGAEMRNVTHIKGLSKLIKLEQFRQTIFGRILRFFGINTGYHRQSGIACLNVISAQLSRSIHTQNAVADVFHHWSSTFETIANRTGLATPFAQTAQTVIQDCPPLSKIDVIRSFQLILRRNPENEAVIRAHQAYATPEALQAHLRNSAEYQARTASLSASARRAYYLLQATLPVSTPTES